MTSKPIERPASHASWIDLDPLARNWPLEMIALAYAAVAAILVGPRLEQGILIALVVAARVGPPVTRGAFRIGLPATLIVIAYDTLGTLRPRLVTADRVVTCGLQSLDASLFTIHGQALPDYFASHHTPALDVFFSVPYAIFIYFAIFYGFVIQARERGRLTAVIWSFVGVYLLSYTFWMILPCAPPWYIQAHGCAVDLNAAPSAAGLERVDDLLGIRYFRGFYGHNKAIFGAMPSLHNAQPMITLLCGWSLAGPKERVAQVFYVLWMLAASIYLTHHWVLDGLAGWLLAAVVVAVATRATAGDRRGPRVGARLSADPAG